MKNLKLLVAFLILSQSGFAMANVCETAVQRIVDQENKEGGAEYHDPQLISPEYAIELVETNNTDLNEDDMNSALVPALEKDQNIEFYLINVDSMGGSGADLLAVNVNDCSVKIRLPVYAD